MDEVLEFLLTPRKIGAHIRIYKIDLNKLIDLYIYLSENYSPIYKSSIDKRRVRDFESTFTTDDKKMFDFRINNRISSSIAALLMLDMDPSILEYYHINEKIIKEIRENEERPFEKRRQIERYVRRTFQSKIYDDVFDVLSLDKKISIEKRMIILETISIKEVGINRFTNFISNIPGLDQSYQIITDRKSYSERYISKLYPYAVTLFLNHDLRFLLREDLKNFINAAIDYYHSNEWRTSIVLCSIAVESIMAELYEEYYAEEAPDRPLGSLIKSVEQKKKFPKKVREKVMALNQARISSVHRSKNPISDKEAIIALRGITQLSLWFLENY